MQKLATKLVDEAANASSGATTLGLVDLREEIERRTMRLAKDYPARTPEDVEGIMVDPFKYYPAAWFDAKGRMLEAGQIEAVRTGKTVEQVRAEFEKRGINIPLMLEELRRSERILAGKEEPLAPAEPETVQ